MSKEMIPFSAFVEAAGPQHIEFVNWLHNHMIENNCTFEIKEAKSGYVVSYIHKSTKRTVANYVFRRKGPMIRIYADNIVGYMEILDKWPGEMKAAIEKAGVCKRLLDPNACNPRCQMGFDFIMDGKRQQKCRNNSFMFFLDEETKPYLKDMMEREMKMRNEL
jgi:hypothetical protein